MKNVARTLSWTGVVFTGLSVVLYAALELSSRSEQAKSPGEKNMGVAVLGMVFGLPMLASAAIGLLCLFVGGLAFAYTRFYPKKSE